MAKNTKQTGTAAASAASEVLHEKAASKPERKAAASALSQTPSKSKSKKK